ncbi:glycosyltransferase [Fibrella sp. USSR17]
MKNLPKISIITPSYNQGQFIEATIRSVLAQSYSNIEYIIVDGGSTDSTMEVVDQYRDRLSLVIHEKDNGQSDAINKGFKAATGELVGWINSDDILYTDCVEQIVKLYSAFGDGSVYYGSVNDWIDADGHIIGTRRLPIKSRNYLLNNNYDLIQQGSFYPTRLVREIGFLNEAIHYCMDLDLWLRLLEHGPIYAFSDYALAGFRKWEETKTSTGGHKFMHDIRTTLLKYGANPYSRAVLKTRYYGIKQRVKATLKAS